MRRGHPFEAKRTALQREKWGEGYLEGVRCTLTEAV